MRPGQPEICTLLRQDHRKVAELLDALIRDGGEGKNVLGLVPQLAADLELHSCAEEHAVYPRLQRRAESKDDADRAQEEHNAIRNLLKELDGLAPTDERCSRLLAQLKEEVDYHVEQEETVLFAKLEKLFNEEELQEIAVEFLAAKEALNAGTLAA